MAHPQMYDEDDPVLALVRRMCAAMPGAREKMSHGRPAFYTVKVFAWYGGVVNGDMHSDRYSQSVLVLPDADEREALLSSPQGFLPAYHGPAGWVGFDLSGSFDADEVAELIDASYRNTAPARLIARLDS